MQKTKKKEHKQIVKYLRKLNKNISNDAYLGINRFRIDLYSEQYTRYDDGYIEIFLLLKVSDLLTTNSAIFTANSCSYIHKINIYVNDFLIRCSSGRTGHYPVLQYVTYDVHKVVPYAGNNKPLVSEYEEGVINSYDWLRR